MRAITLVNKGGGSVAKGIAGTIGEALSGAGIDSEIILVEDKVELMRKLGQKQMTLHLQNKLAAIPKEARPYIDEGYRFSFDMLGEAARTEDDADTLAD